ncbi:hypothetical protein AVEN_67789-1 [Araneus ventricosus]|uniref:Uncharacterized protein n=1 Tax=Araneus ventricosus TaxID=182803 RepID=A0A4Y2J4S2_ARAVE|nr:hypothetical protein AVEN_67789-1 [Araneus ventricosus]
MNRWETVVHEKEERANDPRNALQRMRQWSVGEWSSRLMTSSGDQTTTWHSKEKTTLHTSQQYCLQPRKLETSRKCSVGVKEESPPYDFTKKYALEDFTRQSCIY